MERQLNVFQTIQGFKFFSFIVISAHNFNIKISIVYVYNILKLLLAYNFRYKLKYCINNITILDCRLLNVQTTTRLPIYTDTCIYQTKNSINNTMTNFLTHLQYNYSHIMPHELLNRKDIVNKMSYHLHEPIASVFSSI